VEAKKKAHPRGHEIHEDIDDHEQKPKKVS